MRRLRVALVAMCLVGIPVGNVAAQAPSPALDSPPWLGGRVEMPRHGFAVTLPDDWVAFDLGADVVGQFEGLLRRLGVMPDEKLRSTQEALTQAASDGMQLVAIDGSEEGECLFQALTGRSWTLDDFADAFYLDRLSQDSITDVEPPTPIELPAGPGRVLTMRAQDPDDADFWAPMTVYVIQADSDILMVICTGPERPEDDYLSIAEGIEFLPTVAEANPGPSPAHVAPAPNQDPAIILPAEIDGVSFTIVHLPAEEPTPEQLADPSPGLRILWQALAAVGRGPSEMRMAIASSTPGSAYEYEIVAIAIEGVDGSTFGKAYMAEQIREGARLGGAQSDLSEDEVEEALNEAYGLMSSTSTSGHEYLAAGGDFWFADGNVFFVGVGDLDPAEVVDAVAAVQPGASSEP